MIVCWHGRQQSYGSNSCLLPSKNSTIAVTDVLHPWRTRLTGADAKAFFDEVLPMFSPIVRTADLERFAAQKDSKLPRFSYVGPILHRGRTTCLLGTMRRCDQNSAMPYIIRSLASHHRLHTHMSARIPFYTRIPKYREFRFIRSRHSYLLKTIAQTEISMTSTV